MSQLKINLKSETTFRLGEGPGPPHGYALDHSLCSSARTKIVRRILCN